MGQQESLNDLCHGMRIQMLQQGGNELCGAIFTTGIDVVLQRCRTFPKQQSDNFFKISRTVIIECHGGFINQTEQQIENPTLGYRRGAIATAVMMTVHHFDTVVFVDDVMIGVLVVVVVVVVVATLWG